VADDDKKSFWGSVPGILTGLAAVLTAAGALIYHNASKPKPKHRAVQQESSKQTTQESSKQAPVSQPSQNQLAPPEGFQEQASYSGDCASPPAGSVCIRFRDGYEWLVQDVVAGRHNQVGSWGNHPVLEATGKQARYQHILGTQYVKSESK
jgi:hypothetical protein